MTDKEYEQAMVDEGQRSRLTFDIEVRAMIKEAVEMEREAIATEFMERHEAVKHLNNYWHHAANYVRERGQA
jgi:hypothetical protein